MFNLLVSANATAWETDQLMRMDKQRFKEFSGSESETISLTRPQTLKLLDGLPALLMYEANIPNPGGAIVKYGHIHNIRISGQEITFMFVEVGRLNRSHIYAFSDRLGMKQFEHGRTHWAIKDGGIPTALLKEMIITPRHRFSVAFSFPGEKRDYVAEVDAALTKLLPADRIFYDARFKHELARPDLDIYLERIYHHQAELVVIFICEDYENKQWCRLEWRAIRDIIKNRRGNDVMPVRFDDASVSGLFSLDGYIDARVTTPEKVAQLIHDRLLANQKGAGPSDSAALPMPALPTTVSVSPGAVHEAAERVLSELRQPHEVKQIPVGRPGQFQLETSKLFDDPPTQQYIHSTIPHVFSSQFWDDCVLIAKAAKEWDVTDREPIVSLIRVRPHDDSELSSDNRSEITASVGRLANLAFERAHLS